MYIFTINPHTHTHILYLLVASVSVDTEDEKRNKRLGQLWAWGSVAQGPRVSHHESPASVLPAALRGLGILLSVKMDIYMSECNIQLFVVPWENYIFNKSNCSLSDFLLCSPALQTSLETNEAMNSWACYSSRKSMSLCKFLSVTCWCKMHPHITQAYWIVSRVQSFFFQESERDVSNSLI